LPCRAAARATGRGSLWERVVCCAPAGSASAATNITVRETDTDGRISIWSFLNILLAIGQRG
jgi:hypothetical protein